MKRSLKMICCLALLLCMGCTSKTYLDPDKPITVKLWNYYTGKQMESFNGLVESFNATVGKEKGIIV